MKILAVDSSGLVASIAVIEDDVLIAEYTVDYKKTHSQTLLPMLDEVAKMIELDLKSLDAIAVSAGPGSFTGLRIGSATVKGLGLALDLPIISVPTVDSLAYQMYGTAELVCPIMDARREQVYTGAYSFYTEPVIEGMDSTSAESVANKSDEAAFRFRYGMTTILPQCAMGVEELAEYLNSICAEGGIASGKKIIFLGDGVPVYSDILAQKLKVQYSFAPSHRSRQSAACVGMLGIELFKEGKAQSAAEHKPIYLRVSQAERERNDQMSICRMQEEDLEEVAALEEATFSMPWSVDAFREMVNCPEAVYLVAKDKGHICATAGLRNISGDGEITNVVVREEYRQGGLGYRVMEKLLEEGAQLGCEAYTLEVRVSNQAAIHLYEKLGFVSEGIRPKFYEKPEEDAMIMWRR
ncbi:MAG: tRNA (adenosine(37)-N6)-threonylcarbamoyltransferase complex dimerization subunit type 1 TsaB [Lachnospiraceae bacterium]|nr:tRNA (adenosine(37)-N6)-threonylcarbamoyltransferase complex dimerization subunit type 1 TsaB [Candidatus Merdinaster equi]